MKSQKHFTGYAHATPFPLNELPEGTSLCCNGTENVKKMNKKKMVSRYEKLLIHDRKDINIDSDLICDILNQKPGKFLKDIYCDLENKILVGELNNNKEEIIKYIKENYDIINNQG